MESRIRVELRKSLETFDAILKVPDEESQDKIDAFINGFTTLLSKTMAPFFEIECPPERKFRYSSRTVHEDKPWSTAEMKRMFKVYKRDLRLFNQNKTHLTLQNLRQSMKEYKTLAANPTPRRRSAGLHA